MITAGCRVHNKHDPTYGDRDQMLVLMMLFWFQLVKFTNLKYLNRINITALLLSHQPKWYHS